MILDPGAVVKAELNAFVGRWVYQIDLASLIRQLVVHYFGDVAGVGYEVGGLVDVVEFLQHFL